MRIQLLLLLCMGITLRANISDDPTAPSDAERVNLFFIEALGDEGAYDNLRTLTTEHPGRLGGSQALERAVVWSERVLTAMKLDRVYRQEVMVPHWQRGAPESVRLIHGNGKADALTALALGGSGPSPGWRPPCRSRPGDISR